MSKKADRKSRDLIRKEEIEKIEREKSTKQSWKTIKNVEAMLKKLSRDLSNAKKVESKKLLQIKINIYERRNKSLIVAKKNKEKKREQEQNISANTMNEGNRGARTIMSNLTQKTFNSRLPTTPTFKMMATTGKERDNSQKTTVILESLGLTRKKETKNKGTEEEQKKEEINHNIVTQEKDRTIMSDITKWTKDEQSKKLTKQQNGRKRSKN